jgi:hypothetical protein
MKRWIRFTLPAGLVIYAAYTIGKRYIQISDTAATVLCYISIALMMVGIAYHGWCFGKGKNPYAK